MKPRYFFSGHELVGAHIDQCLKPLGWKRVDDASQAAVAFTYCTSSTELEDAYFEEEGLVKRAASESLLIDLSPTSPSFARELAAIAMVNDLKFIEAPLAVEDAFAPDAFGGPDGLTCYVAGQDDDVDEAIDLLETIAAHVVRAGEGGAAQLAKAHHTIQIVAIISSAIEAEAFRRSFAESSSFNEPLGTPSTVGEGGLTACEAQTDLARRAMSAVERKDFEGGLPVELLFADVSAALDAADDVNLILPQLESVGHLIELLALIGGSSKSPAALSLIYGSDEESAAHGLDWSRAETIISEYESFDDDGHDEGGFGLGGSFGGYSSN